MYTVPSLPAYAPLPQASKQAATAYPACPGALFTGLLLWRCGSAHWDNRLARCREPCRLLGKLQSSLARCRLKHVLQVPTRRPPKAKHIDVPDVTVHDVTGRAGAPAPGARRVVRRGYRVKRCASRVSMLIDRRDHTAASAGSHVARESCHCASCHSAQPTRTVFRLLL